jgi:glutathione peroxidase
MFRILFISLIFAVFFFSNFNAQDQSNNTNKKEGENLSHINDISVLDMDKKSILLSDYNGNVLLIVNVASECGYTPQYQGLEEIYKEYHPKGFEILAFPCNDFGEQEPGTNEEIKNFCSVNYGITFKLFDKIKVLGQERSPLYERLINNPATEKGDVKWNFEKFLVSRDGKIVARFRTKVEPTSDEIITAIEKELAKLYP